MDLKLPVLNAYLTSVKINICTFAIHGCIIDIIINMLDVSLPEESILLSFTHSKLSLPKIHLLHWRK